MTKVHHGNKIWWLCGLSRQPARLHFACRFEENSQRAQQCFSAESAQCIIGQPVSTSLDQTLQVSGRLPIDRWESQRAPKDNGQVFPRAQTETVIYNRTVSSCCIRV